MVLDGASFSNLPIPGQKCFFSEYRLPLSKEIQSYLPSRLICKCDLSSVIDKKEKFLLLFKTAACAKGAFCVSDCAETLSVIVVHRYVKIKFYNRDIGFNI